MTPPVIDLGALLGPVAGSAPCGRDLSWEPDYDAIREARRAEDDSLEQGAWRRKPKAADWDRVIELAAECLGRKAKDLRIAAWMTEALTRAHGFAGLRDGILLLTGLVQRYWEDLYPRIDDGDLEARAGVLAFLEGATQLPLAIRDVPLTGGPDGERYSYLRWQETRDVPRGDDPSGDGQEPRSGRGSRPTPDQFNAAVARSPLHFHESLSDDLREGVDAFEAFDAIVRERFGHDAPSLSNIRQSLDDCRRLLDPILQEKRRRRPDASPAVPGGVEAGPCEEATGVRLAGDDGVEVRQGDGADVAAGRVTSVGAPGPIVDVDDARGRILDAAAYWRTNAPGEPAPYAVVRALHLAEACRRPRPGGPDDRPGPSGEVRRSLRRLAAEGAWGALAEESERAMARPEGHSWLDAHRYAIAAMEAGASGDDPSACAAVARGLLRALLAEFPGLPEAELDDGTPAASPETRAWLEAEGLLESGHGASRPGPPDFDGDSVEMTPRDDDPAGGGPKPDAWQQAVEAVDGGRIREGVALFRGALATARTGRERFVLGLKLAELCLRAGHHRAALPQLEDLSRQVDEFHLDRWEDESLIARVWDALYRCLRDACTGDGLEDRRRQAYARLCRLDLDRALRYGNDEAVPANPAGNPRA